MVKSAVASKGFKIPIGGRGRAGGAGGRELAGIG